MPRLHRLFLLAGCAAAVAFAQAPSTIQLTVDATQAPLGIVRTHMTMPVSPGPLTVYYPKWIPGEHEPDGPIGNLAGLKFTGNGQPIPWTRDLLDVFTFHLVVPSGVGQLDVAFDYLEGSGQQYTSGASATDKLVVISWNQNLLYPAGAPAQQLSYQATLLLPPEWKFGTALPVDHQSGATIRFAAAPLNRLVDSPVLAGEYYRAMDITPPGETIHHELDIAADHPADLNANPELQRDMTRLVVESGKLFGTRHYRDYHFLLTLSDHVAHFGLEHHESNDSRLPESVLLLPIGDQIVGDILPHEFVHSWNGKFRRPADLSPPYYEQPMQTDLLWVYEGLTDYLGHVLATRAGFWTPGQFEQYFASIAASLGPGRPGRTWRDLADTANAVPGMFEEQANDSWLNWRRGTDYYEEGDLLWLEVATIIHDQSHGQKSFEDFCRAFYGGPNQGPELKTYTLDDLVAALNQVQPYDWRGFFRQRLTSLSPDAPVNGLAAGGWRVAYGPAPAADAPPSLQGGVDAAYSIGLVLETDGTVRDSFVGSPAFLAGIASGMKIAGVNRHTFSPEALRLAIAASATSPQPLELLVVNDGYFSTVNIMDHNGPRYPRLERDSSRPDYLAQILQPLGGP